MKGKIISLLMSTMLAVLALASCDIGITNKEYKPTPDSYFTFTYIEESDAYSIAAKDGVTLPSELKLPAKYSGKDIVSISYEGFIGDENVTRVTIPAGYEKIGVSAFKDCKNLKSVTINADITAIGSMAFSECKVLRTVTFPASLKEIGAYAFYDTAIYSAKFKALEKIDEYAFYGCEYLKNVYIPETTSQIGDFAFGGCGIVNFDVAAANPYYTVRNGEIVNK